MNLNCLLFNDFETLDLFGPVEVFGKIGNCSIQYFSVNGENITNRDNIQIATKNICKIEKYDILLVPGGIGTRILVDDDDFIKKLKNLAEKSSWCLTICTGSALLAKTGLLDNYEATSNKMAFEWVKNIGRNVIWKNKARWVIDGKYYTSSGISAGIDMSLGFICDQFGDEIARKISKIIEYEWNDNKNNDIYGI
jgi:putative intracellular protease/amidase